MIPTSVALLVALPTLIFLIALRAWERPSVFDYEAEAYRDVEEWDEQLEDLDGWKR